MGLVVIVLPAAGASSRMRGADKLMEMVDDRPLLRRQAARARATGAAVLVTLPPDRPARAEALAGLGVDQRVIAEAAEGMAASLRMAAHWAQGRAMMVLPADMPELDTDDLLAMLEAHRETPTRILRGATADGTAGHPVLFPADLLDEFQALAGDEGARSVLARHRDRIRLIPLPENHALTDLDTPEAWASWRSGRQAARPPDRTDQD